MAVIEFVGDNLHTAPRSDTPLALIVPHCRLVHQLTKVGGAHLFGITRWSPNLQWEVAAPTQRVVEYMKIAYVIQMKMRQKEFIK